MKITKNNQKEREFINKLISGSQVVLMRHAESKHNEESKKLELNEHTDYDFFKEHYKYRTKRCFYHQSRKGTMQNNIKNY